MTYKTVEERQAAKKASAKRAMDKYLSNPDNYQKVLQRNKTWSANNKERHNELIKRWSKDNRARVNEIALNSQKASGYAANKKFKASNPDKISSFGKRWKAKNAHRVRAYLDKRKQFLKQAKPSWANDFFISEAYHLARLRTTLTGIPWQVDHIVPLVSDLVCGLHWEGNLQVITRTENATKNNKFTPE